MSVGRSRPPGPRLRAGSECLRWLVRIIVIVTTFAIGTTTATAVTYTYDVPVLVRADAYRTETGAAASHQPTSMSERTASPLAKAPGTSTTRVSAGVATNTADDVIGAVCSFSGETRVLMADGTTKPISEIEVGDEVLAYDPETGERGPREVAHLWVHQDTLVDLAIGGAIVTTTEDHPFWNETDGRWERADALDSGDFVLTANGGRLRAGRMGRVTHSASAYNLTVDEIHTYFVLVGSQSVLVHNTCGDFLSPPSQIAERLRVSTREVKDAIHAVKTNLPRGGPICNPDVVVDAVTGEVFPQLPGGGVGDSIGNIFDYLPGAG